VQDESQVRRFGDRYGYPLVLKPDLGVGAARTFRVDQPQDVFAAFSSGGLEGYVVQRYVDGTILTYDGLTDVDGRTVFALSHVYSEGVMETVNERRDMSFWTCPQATPAVEELGQATVRAFGLRERFFHIEIFRRPDGSHLVLEVNLRPPGGFMTDMMNYASEMDVYALWARVLTQDPSLSSFVCRPRFHVAHVGRRQGTRYQRSADEVRARLGSRLLWHRPVPPIFSAIMGDEMFLTRHETADEMRQDIAFIQARAS
jgi:biotin carboxylase